MQVIFFYKDVPIHASFVCFVLHSFCELFSIVHSTALACVFLFAASNRYNQDTSSIFLHHQYSHHHACNCSIPLIDNGKMMFCSVLHLQNPRQFTMGWVFAQHGEFVPILLVPYTQSLDLSLQLIVILILTVSRIVPIRAYGQNSAYYSYKVVVWHLLICHLAIPQDVWFFLISRAFILRSWLLR